MALSPVTPPSHSPSSSPSLNLAQSRTRPDAQPASGHPTNRIHAPRRCSGTHASHNALPRAAARCRALPQRRRERRPHARKMPSSLPARMPHDNKCGATPWRPEAPLTPTRPRRVAHRLRGGVSGRLVPPKLNFCLSAGLRMRKEHIKLSSTDMTCKRRGGRGTWKG